MDEKKGRFTKSRPYFGLRRLDTTNRHQYTWNHTLTNFHGRVRIVLYLKKLEVKIKTETLGNKQTDRDSRDLFLYIYSVVVPVLTDGRDQVHPPMLTGTTGKFYPYDYDRSSTLFSFIPCFEYPKMFTGEDL